MASLPSYRDLPEPAGAPPKGSWYVWGRNDVFGCLNLLTPERVADAAKLVRRGAVFALNWSMGLPDPPLFRRARFTHEITGTATSTSHDDVLHGWNTQSSSQWDGFRHIRNPHHGRFGGVADEDHGIHHWAQRGIVGRAVLADVGRWRVAQGRPIRYRDSDPIEVDEIAACLAAQGSVVREGDILLMRTGWVAWYETLPRSTREELADPLLFRAPGLVPGERTFEFLWDLHIAAIGADNPGVEIWPPSGLDYETYQREREDPDRQQELFAHTHLLPMLGLPLGELWNLEPLAADCAVDGRYESFFTSAPLNLPAGVASPPNALAIK